MVDVQSLRDVLADQHAVQLAVLFGSQARGRAQSRSDVDIGLRLAPATAENRQHAVVEVGRTVRREVDLVDLDSAPPLLRFQIARDGVVLVEREPRLWSGFKAKAMTDWWDWAPTARRLHGIYIRRLREQVAHGRS